MDFSEPKDQAWNSTIIRQTPTSRECLLTTTLLSLIKTLKKNWHIIPQATKKGDGKIHKRQILSFHCPLAMDCSFICVPFIVDVFCAAPSNASFKSKSDLIINFSDCGRQSDCSIVFVVRLTFEFHN